LWAAALAALGVYSLHVTVGFPPKGGPDWHLLCPLAYLLAAAICFTRAAAIERERLIWGLFATGILLEAISWVYYYTAFRHRAAPPYPSVADAIGICFYVASFGALMLMVRDRLRRFSRNLWLDAVIGVLALAAVVAAVLVHPIVTSTGGDEGAVATSLAYPLADVLTLTLVLGVFALSGWRPERRWMLIGVAWAILTVTDAIYVSQAASGTFVARGMLDTCWAVVNLLIAWAAWDRSKRPPLRFDGWQVLGVPLAFTSIAIGVLVYGNFEPLNPTAVTLALLALVGSIAATVSSYLEQRKLETLARRDALTGLFNYREFHRRLEERIEAARLDGDQKFAVALFDVDGFKDVNDLRGHAEGDRVLREVARAIGGARRSGDTAARLGGDEFGVLMHDADVEGATALARRMSERVDSLGEGIGISYGVAEWPGDGPGKELLLLRADVAMYAAKSGEAERPIAAVPERDRRARDFDTSPALGRRRQVADAIDAERERDNAQLRAYAEAVRVTYAQGLERAQQLKQNYLATVLTLASAVEAKDEYTGGHINRVHRLGLLLAGELVPNEVDDPRMAYGFLLHDIGKLAVPDAILNKTGPLDDEEWELMRSHPEAGVRILAPIPFLGRAMDVVRHHHERWDGTGYPDGLASEEIPMWSRIFAVVDSVDAMTSDRPYRAALPLEIAHQELRKGAGTQFDPLCVAAFMRLEASRVEDLIEESSSARTVQPIPRPATALMTANGRPDEKD
jgi:diguanylate cyclase (GGDEF)-like protein